MVDLDSYDEEMDEISPDLIDERLKILSPAWWCRIEAFRLSELLRTHVRLALETKTDRKRVIRMLERVRTAVLDVGTEDDES